MGILQALESILRSALTHGSDDTLSGYFSYKHGTLHVEEQHLLLLRFNTNWSRFKVYNERDVQYWREQYAELLKVRGE